MKKILVVSLVMLMMGMGIFAGETSDLTAPDGPVYEMERNGVAGIWMDVETARYVFYYFNLYPQVEAQRAEMSLQAESLTGSYIQLQAEFDELKLAAGITIGILGGIGAITITLLIIDAISRSK